MTIEVLVRDEAPTATSVQAAMKLITTLRQEKGLTPAEVASRINGNRRDVVARVEGLSEEEPTVADFFVYARAIGFDLALVMQPRAAS